MPATDKGRALIINIVQFSETAKWANRYGAPYDTYHLNELLRDLGYKVETYDDELEDFTLKRLQETIKGFKKNCVDDQVASFVVFIGSHGEYGNIIMSNSEKANLFNHVIFPMTRVPEKKQIDEQQKWSSIPKIFIVSACREPPKDSKTHKDVENTVVCYSCLPNNYSFRNDNVGTYYVNHFTQLMMQHAHKLDFLAILQKVTRFLEINKKFSLSFMHKFCLFSLKIEEKLSEDSGLQQPTYEPYGGFTTFYFTLMPEQKDMS